MLTYAATVSTCDDEPICASMLREQRLFDSRTLLPESRVRDVSLGKESASISVESKIA